MICIYQQHLNLTKFSHYLHLLKLDCHFFEIGRYQKLKNHLHQQLNNINLNVKNLGLFFYHL